MGRKRIYDTPAEKQKAYRERKRNTDKPESVTFQEMPAPVLRWHGSKYRIAEWVIERFPPHTCYVEPFGGGASVLLNKSLSKHEILNDLDGDVINFFRVLREQPDALIRAIEFTPYARQEVDLAREKTDDPLERARRFYVLAWQQHHPGRVGKNTGWRMMYKDTRNWGVVQDWNRTEHLYDVAARLKYVQIECRDAFEVIQKYDTKDTLHFIDPPYVWNTRAESWRGRAYTHELNDGDHRRLADLLKQVQGMVVLCGYPSALYDELYKGWTVITKNNQNGAGKSATECLWLNPQATDVKRLPLFG